MTKDNATTSENVVHRLAIDDLLTRYSLAMDDEDFDLLDTVFTPDAILDYSGGGGPCAPYPEVKAWLAKSFRAMHPARMHVINQRHVVIDGATARVRAYFLNYYAVQMPEGSFLNSLGGGFYNHKLELRPEGWRSVAFYPHIMWRDANVPLPHPHAARSNQVWDFGSPPRPRS